MDILMVIKTSGLLYDDRLQKECTTLRSLGLNPEIIALEDENRRCWGIMEDGTPFHSISLLTRKLLPHKRGLAIKVLEMYIRFIWRIFQVRPQVLWLHNVEMTGLIPIAWIMKRLKLINRLIWDQHELPHSKIFVNYFTRNAFKIFIAACNAVVVANKERREFILTRNGDRYARQFHVIENLVSEKFISLPHGGIPNKLQKFLQGCPYFLSQGGARPDRYFKELVEAVMLFDFFKLVFVGYYCPKIFAALKERWEKKLDERVYFTDWIPFASLVNYIDNAFANIVLYSQDNENGRLCASNRLYQALSRGIPVIVGSNPPMANVVQRWDCGVVLSDDGRSVKNIQKGIRDLHISYDKFRKNAEAIRSNMKWESQAEAIMNIVDYDPRTLR